jgi:hypothetical protein
MHFCGLAYSRSVEPVGQTSDHFIDLEKLTFEAEFEKYVRDAFAPVGLMIDEWAEDLPAGEVHDVPIVVVNDRDKAWEGEVTLRILRAKNPIFEWSESCRVDALSTGGLAITATVPSRPGNYQLVAELVGPDAEPVRSWRDFAVLTKKEREARDGIAVRKPVSASSSAVVDGVAYPAEFAVDGIRTTRWSSQFSDPQWLAIDLGEPVEITRVELLWEDACATAYAIEVSLDGEIWKAVYRTGKGDGGIDDIRFDPTRARWVRFHGTKRGTPYGYSLWEMRVFK